MLTANKSEFYVPIHTNTFVFSIVLYYIIIYNVNIIKDK